MIARLSPLLVPLVTALVLASACAHAPKPMVFARIDEAKLGPAKSGFEGSPTLWAKAEGLRRRAEEAFSRGDTATAELLGEQALATYHHAAATARLSIATVRQSKDAARFAKAREQLEADEKTLIEVDREADRLEAEVAIRREALAPAVSGKTDAAREAARWIAMRANLSVAEALCTGAYLLAPKAKGVDEARRVLAEVMTKALPSEAKDKPAPIDASARARALCLKALTTARSVTVASGGPAGEALTASLKEKGIDAVPDERGLVVTLSQDGKGAAFEGSKLTAAGKEKLDLLGKAAKEHGTFAVVIVVHSAAGKVDAARDGARADAAKQTLTAVGADPAKIGTSTPGATLPAYDSKEPKTQAKNERVEIIFVGK